MCVCTVLDHERRGSLPPFAATIPHEVFMQGRWALLGKPNAMKLCLGVGSSSGR